MRRQKETWIMIAANYVYSGSRTHALQWILLISIVGLKFIVIYLYGESKSVLRGECGAGVVIYSYNLIASHFTEVV